MFNRADSSYIPGGVVSGTALIRPDFPELKEDQVLNGHSQSFALLVAPPANQPYREP